MESITINGALVPIPPDILAQGREAVGAWVAAEVRTTDTPPAPVSITPPKPARARDPEA